MIEVKGLTKRYGDRVAVDDVTFSVQPGTVTGFLGPNGAGKSTTMRLIAGLDRPTGGSVRVNGGRFTDSRSPMAELGLLLEARAFHPGRSARNHLLTLARTAGIGPRRVDDVLDLVGLTAVAHKRAGGFSLGMSQRLGVATALLGDPQTIVLDEPMNGLDLDGVRWIRALLRRLAAEGRTVFVSSHLMSEVAQTATQLIVLGRGRLIADCTVDEFVARGHSATVAVRAPDLTRLSTHLGNQLPDAHISVANDILTVQGASAEQVGMVAWRVGIPVTELTTIQASLEEAFMAATSDFVEYTSPAASEN